MKASKPSSAMLRPGRRIKNPRIKRVKKLTMHQSPRCGGTFRYDRRTKGVFAPIYAVSHSRLIDYLYCRISTISPLHFVTPDLSLQSLDILFWGRFRQISQKAVSGLYSIDCLESAMIY